ncbi:MAG: serine/threonine protein kinase [Planctomycetes bacterium]|nr:serine/threonine protein kinase [Planctomycetota bacterium]
MPNTTVTALLQAAMRRRLITRDRAVALGNQLITAEDDVEAVRARLAEIKAPDAIMLRELLPGPGLPDVAPYRRLASLGEGRTASTWLGCAESGGPPVVIKLYHPNRIKPGAEVELFIGDVAPLVGQAHAYLVGYLAVFAAGDGRAVLVQQYVPGRDLASRAATKGAMAEAKALALLRQAAKGLAELEHAGIDHGLLHPGNVLLDPDNRARLTDYGLAFARTLQAPRAGWDAQSLMLHPWSAPEALANPARLGAAADCYALGCIAFWLLSGKTPFPGTPEQQALQQANASRPDVRMHIPAVSEITAKTILKAMQIAPVKRYRRPTELAASLQRNLDRLTGGVGSDTRELPADATSDLPKAWSLLDPDASADPPEVESQVLEHIEDVPPPPTSRKRTPSGERKRSSSGDRKRPPLTLE